MSESIFVYSRLRSVSNEVEVKPPGAVTVKNVAFTMNGVFNEDAKQADVYDQAAAPLVERVLAGFNSTMLAYGQTGSGKTYTMLGSEEAKANLDKELGEEHGIIPRASKQLFAGLRDGQTVQVSYVEVYNDSINDMLNPSYGKEKGMNLPLREVNMQAGGKACVPDGLTRSPAKDSADVMRLIAKGDNNRVVAAMQMNPRSSRGHGIVALHVVDREGEPYGRLTLCDLAGMESSKKSAAVDAGPSSLAIRKEEAKRINISLLALSSVVSVLASKGASRVPYRDSKLTRILQDSLGGNCQCAIVVTVRCEKENLEEAINTLRFAQRAAAIKVQIVSNAEARANARPKAAKLAEELEAARSVMANFEDQLASAEGAKAQLLAEVQTLMDEMQLLQRDNARRETEAAKLQQQNHLAEDSKKKEKNDPLGRVKMEAVADFEPEDAKETSMFGGDIVEVFTKKPAPAGWWYADNGGKIGLVPQSFLVELEGDADIAEVVWLRTRVYELEEENRVLRQRDLMHKMAALSSRTGGEAEDGPKMQLTEGFQMDQLEVFAPIQEAASPAKQSQSEPEPAAPPRVKKAKSRLGSALLFSRGGSARNVRAGK